MGGTASITAPRGPWTSLGREFVFCLFPFICFVLFRRWVCSHGIMATRWYSMVLDSVFQSKAVGFVGTKQSSFSLLARLRVETWNGGVARTVQWGWKGADAPCWDDALPSNADCPSGFE
jgi:hypothetical protein